MIQSDLDFLVSWVHQTIYVLMWPRIKSHIEEQEKQAIFTGIGVFKDFKFPL